MTDTLLLTRIASLEENLARVDESLQRLRVWQSNVERHSQDELPVAEDLWQHLNMQVRVQFKNERAALARLRLRLDANGDGDGDSAPADQEDQPLTTKQAWKEYARLRDESERLFEECLEFIGGLAFRRTGLDQERMCELADGLILACARAAYGEAWYFLTVPSLREVVTKSRMRLSRIRFPEWTLWTLPATAYVLGHEVMEEQEVAPFISGRMEAWARQDVAERHVHVLLSDIFGAYVMGPAYGHAGIRLHFDPSHAFAEDRDHPAESSRTHVVLATLERMDACGRDQGWKAQVAALDDQWRAALSAAGPAGAPPDAPEALDELVNEALVHFDAKLNVTAEYSIVGWTEAAQLYQRWSVQAENSARPDALATEPDKFMTPRDVLNAAWLLRVERPADADRIERAAAGMCRALLSPEDREKPGPAQDTVPSD